MTEKNNRRVDRAVYEQETSPIQAGKNLSWGSIIAGAVSAAAVFTVLSLLTAALGFGLFAPTSSNPMAGVGMGTGIWTIITLIISFCAGGFVAGYSARSTGLLHGAITWAVTILLLITLVFNAVASALGMAGNVIGSVAGTAGDAVGNVAGSVSDVAGDAGSKALEKAGAEISDVDTEELQGNLEQYLADTEVPELQPDYLEGQLQESRDEITAAVKDLAVNPENKDQIIKNLTDSLSERAKTIADSADKEAIDNAVAKNTDLTEEEASEVSENIYNGLQDASKEAEKTINNASEEITRLSNEASDKVDETVEGAKEGAEDASNKASAGSVLVFVGLVLALVVSAYAGRLGERKSKEFVRK